MTIIEMGMVINMEGGLRRKEGTRYEEKGERKGNRMEGRGEGRKGRRMEGRRKEGG